MEGDDGSRSSPDRNNSRKRSYAELTTPRPRAPQQLPMQFNFHSPTFPQAPSESLNRNFPPPIVPTRYHGDGLDMRRPLMSDQPIRTSYVGTADDVIDLTSEPETSADTTSRESTNTILPARTPEVIDLADDDNEDQPAQSDRVTSYVDLENQSDDEDVEVLEVRPRTDRPAPLPPNPPQRRHTDNHWPGSSNFMNPFFNRSGLGGVHRFTQALWGRAPPPTSYAIDPYAVMDDLQPRRNARPEWLHGPLDMDYDQVAFDLGIRPPAVERPVPTPVRVDPPGSAPEGFTRAPKEDEILVCPNCDIELGTGEDDIQKQIWIIRECGHVYCGRCVKAKERSKRLLPKCVVNGCSSKITAAKKTAFMLYI